MPYYEYSCHDGHDTTKLYLTFTEANNYVDSIVCPEKGCGKTAERRMSIPLPAHFYGNPDGYHKPSPTKRTSYKLVTERGNASSAG